MSKLDLLIQERNKRLNNIDLLSDCFPQQQAFINDTSIQKAIFCNRRAGKSWALAVCLLKAALENPKTKSLYFGLTEESAKNVMWMNTIEVLCNKHNIKFTATMKPLVITFENGSQIRFTGDDATPRQIDKALGGKYLTTVFDECQSIKNDLKSWIEDKVGPASIDYGGKIICAGTAGDLIGDDRYWYQITRQDGKRIPGWSVHEWTAFDNPFIATKMKAFLEDKKRLNPDIEQEPGFRQQYLNQWVLERSSRVYKYSPTKNLLLDPLIIKSLQDVDRKWNYIISVDFGYEDDTAFVVQAFNKHDLNHYIVESFKLKHLFTDDIGKILTELKNKYNPTYMVVDGQEKRLAEDLRMRYRLPVLIAEKLGKNTHITFMNNDFQNSKIKVIEANNDALIKEWNELMLDPKLLALGIFKEDPTKDNHLADAALYGHHFSKHFRATPEKPKETEVSYMRKSAEKMAETNHNNKEKTAYDYLEEIYD